MWYAVAAMWPGGGWGVEEHTAHCAGGPASLPGAQRGREAGTRCCEVRQSVGSRAVRVLW